jgi:DNA-binding transcriptional LysR family regulator
MEHKMDLLALSDFNLVATHGGFGKASRASGQPKATLSRHVRELEDSLGVRLIERGARTLRLTDEGAILHARTEQPFGDIAEAAQDVRAGLGRPSGRLRVSVPLLFAHTTMGRLSAAFIAAFPGVQLEVTAEDRFTDLVEDGYDVVVRINPRPNDDFVGRCFLKAPLVLVAPASMARPAPGTNGDLCPTVPAVMRTGPSDAAIWRVVDRGEERAYRPKAVLRFSSPLLMREAALAGAGVAMVSQSVVAGDLAAGRLVSWGTATEGHIEAWVLHASRRLTSPKVTAFVCDSFRDGML